jgi:hypothetical protein
MCFASARRCEWAPDDVQLTRLSPLRPPVPDSGVEAPIAGSPFACPPSHGRSGGIDHFGFRLTDVRPALVLVVSGSLWLTPAALAQQSDKPETAYVYKADGTRHCDTAPGIPLDSMAQQLLHSGIHVYTQRKSHDGREGIAVCANPTGSINVYEIAESDLPRALELGFQRLDPSWLDTR